MSKAWEVADLFLSIRKGTLNDPTGEKGEYIPTVSSEANLIATEVSTVHNTIQDPKTLKETKELLSNIKISLTKIAERATSLAKKPPRILKRIKFHREGPIMAINLNNMPCKIINEDGTETLTNIMLRYRDALRNDNIREIIEHRGRWNQSDYGVLSMIINNQEILLAVAGRNGARNLFPITQMSVYLDDAIGTLVIRKVAARTPQVQQGPQEEEASTLFESPETQGPTKNQQESEEPLPEEMP